MLKVYLNVIKHSFLQVLKSCKDVNFVYEHVLLIHLSLNEYLFRPSTCSPILSSYCWLSYFSAIEDYKRIKSELKSDQILSILVLF